MNENINLCEILKDCPINTEFYSPMIGNCKLSNVSSNDVVVTNPSQGFLHINSDATATFHGHKTAELMLFPSQTQRDWSKWECLKSKFDPKTLKPFDKVLVRSEKNLLWGCEFFSHLSRNADYPCVAIRISYRYCIPYNDDTKHLVGTSDEAPEQYRYWEDQE